jgi:hypothetical protein
MRHCVTHGFECGGRDGAAVTVKDAEDAAHIFKPDLRVLKELGGLVWEAKTG